MSVTLISDKLKAALLQSAIQGKLTQQLPEDGDARDLLKQIKAEKERLINEKVIKKEKPLPEITEDEIPFDIPDNWVWVRFNDIVNFHLGKTPPRSDAKYWKNNYPWISIADMIDGGVITKTKEQISEEGKRKSFSNICISLKGTLIMSFKLTIGKISILGIDAYHNEAIISINPIKDDTFNTFRNFLMLILPSIAKSGNFNNAMKGSTLNKQSLSELLIPFPPLTEQHRIVEAIETALAKIDKLKVDETKLYDIQQAFPTKLRASLLQSAIQGKLTQQLPEDGDARDLLKQIEAEKERLINEKVIKKEKPLPEITEDEIPFDIPDNWVWVRLGNITYNRGQKKPKKPITYIDISSIDNKKQKLGTNLAILEAKNAPSRARKIVEKGDIIYATVRPYLLNTCIIDIDIKPEPIVSTGFAVLCTPFFIMNKYLLYSLISPFFNNYANDNENAKGVAYPAINDQKLKNGLIPLPPLAEQHRIVEVIETASVKIDKLNKLTE